MRIDITPEKEEQLKPLLSSLYNAASDYMESSYKKDAREGWDYYTGVLPGVAHPSMVPATDRTCYTLVETAWEDLVEIYTTGEDVVSFAPVGIEDVHSCKAGTQLVNQIFLRAQNGKSLLQDALRTALVEGSAIIKAYWSDDEKETHTVKQEDVPNNEQEILEYILGLREAGFIINDEDVEAIENDKGTIDLTVTYSLIREYVKTELLPIEEFVIEPGTKSISQSNYMCHRVLKSKEQLKEQYGLTDDELSEINTNDNDLSAWSVNAARTDYRTNIDDDNGSDSDDPAFRVWLREHYVKTGLLSNDGSVRLYQILQIDEGKFIRITETFTFPFYVLSPITIPNNVFGYPFIRSVNDIQCDLAWAKQELHTYAHKAAVPNYQAVSGQFNQRDLMNPNLGVVYQVDAMGSIALMPQAPMPPIDSIIALANQEKEERTGISSSQAGLASDGLQTMRASEASVNNMLALATGRVRAMAHSIANGGYSDLFKAIYTLYKDNSSRPLQVLTAYGVETIQPSQLSDRDHLVINIALTSQEKEKKAVKLQMLLDWITKVSSISSPFMQPQQQAWLISEYGNCLGYPNTYDYDLLPENSTSLN